MSETDGPVVRVTLRDIHQGVQQLQGDVRSMRQELAVQNSERKADADRLADHETRIRRTEKWTYGIPASVVLALGSILAAVDL